MDSRLVLFLLALIAFVAAEDIDNKQLFLQYHVAPLDYPLIAGSHQQQFSITATNMGREAVHLKHIFVSYNFGNCSNCLSGGQYGLDYCYVQQLDAPYYCSVNGGAVGISPRTGFANITVTDTALQVLLVVNRVSATPGSTQITISENSKDPGGGQKGMLLVHKTITMAPSNLGRLSYYPRGGLEYSLFVGVKNPYLTRNNPFITQLYRNGQDLGLQIFDYNGGDFWILGVNISDTADINVFTLKERDSVTGITIYKQIVISRPA